MVKRTRRHSLGGLSPTLVKSLLEHCDDAVMLTDGHHIVRWANNASAALFGIDTDAVAGHSIAELFPERLQPMVLGLLDDFIHDAVVSRTIEAHYTELRCLTPHGEIVPEMSLVRGADGDEPVVMIFIRDRTDWYRREQELDALACTDPLTRLLNRRAFTQRAKERLAASTAGDQNAVVMVDIDDFKRINDTYGHLIGDVVLTALAKRLANQCRARDLLGRWGGEEFTFLLEGTDQATAIMMSERIRATVAGSAIRASTVTQSLVLELTVSIGVSTGTGPGCTLPMLTEAADRGLYEVKARGGNGVRYRGSSPVTASPMLRRTTRRQRGSLARPRLVAAPRGSQSPSWFADDAAAHVDDPDDPVQAYLLVAGENVRLLFQLQATAARYYTDMALAPANGVAHLTE